MPIDDAHPVPNRTSFVYIVASLSRVLYIGVTNDLERRATQHRDKLIPGFTTKYNIRYLVYFEEFDRIDEAITRGETTQALDAREENKIDRAAQSSVE